MEVKITLTIRDKDNNPGHISFMGDFNMPNLCTENGYLTVTSICGMSIDCMPDREVDYGKIN